MRKYLNFTVKPHNKHIVGDIDAEFLSSFWDLMETLNYSFDVEIDEYIQIINDLLNGLTVNVGDYDVAIDVNDKDTVHKLQETLDELIKEIKK
jgi:hypothetical protein